MILPKSTLPHLAYVWLFLCIAVDSVRLNAQPIVGHGSIRSLRSDIITAPFIKNVPAARIRSILPEGTMVKKGDLLVTFESTQLNEKIIALKNTVQLQIAANQNAEQDAQAKIDDAKLDLQTAQKKIEEKKLDTSKLTEAYSRSYLEEAEIDVDIERAYYHSAERAIEIHTNRLRVVMDYSKALYTRSRKQLDRMENDGDTKMKIVSPMSGVVVYKSTFDDGKWVKPARGIDFRRSTPILEVLSPDDLIAEIYFAEKHFAAVQEGAAVQIVLLSDETRIIPAKIINKQNFMLQKGDVLRNWAIPDWDQKIFKTQVAMSEKPHWIKPNMNVKVVIP